MRTLYLSLILIPLMTTLLGCAEKSKEPAGADAGPVNCRQDWPLKARTELSDESLQNAYATGMPSREVEVVSQCLTEVLPVGSYQGQLLDGRSCEVQVRPGATGTGLEVAMTVSAQDVHPEESFSFHIYNGARALSLLRTRTSTRMSYETLALRQSFSGVQALIQTLSLRRVDAEIRSVYIYDQEKLGQAGMAAADCQDLIPIK